MVESKIVTTGEDGCINKIYGLVGNVDGWTQEQTGSSYRVIRGANYNIGGNNFPVAFRNSAYPFYESYKF